MSAPPILSQITGDSARARRDDPLTSHEAADSISFEALEASEVEVLEILAALKEPATASLLEAMNAQRAWQIPGVHAWSPSRIRTALSQLVKKGHVEEAGEGKTPRGNRAITWRLTEKTSPKGQD